MELLLILIYTAICVAAFLREPQLASPVISLQRASTGFTKSNMMAIAPKCCLSGGRPALRARTSVRLGRSSEGSVMLKAML
jgi:hypothetical protein